MDSFSVKDAINVDGKKFDFYNITKVPKEFNVERLPYSLKILLENLLRLEDGSVVTKQDITTLLQWQPQAAPVDEISFKPSRVILQDFTGVPAVVDLAAMRDAIVKLGGSATAINPLSPVDLVIDHSVMVDHYAKSDSLSLNSALEFSRNKERYSFLKWGQSTFNNFKVVPPGTGIVHQVNLEYLARVVFSDNSLAYPDTLVGTDSHTTMINALGILGWGVGGIEAEAAMLGQSIPMLIPQVVGFELIGSMSEGTTATDLVLTVVQMLREKGVVGKFVEFFGSGLDNLPLADRATISNMAPEYGATCGMFPIDQETIDFLRLTGRDESKLELIKSYAIAQGIFRTNNSAPAEYSDTLKLDLSEVVPSIAGPKRPQDKVSLKEAKSCLRETAQADRITITTNDEPDLNHGSVVIAAITSCTNTSNPDVMIAAGLVAKKAFELGIKVKPWVKTSLAPGSQVVTDYLKKSNLLDYLEKLGFAIVGYGCTTCIGNSGPLPPAVSKKIGEQGLATTAVLSGNRNFEGRIHAEVKYAYLASPPLVVAYALAGTMDIDFYNEPLATVSGKEIFLKDIWPQNSEIQSMVGSNLSAPMFISRYAKVYNGDDKWRGIKVDTSECYSWQESSTYVKLPPFFNDMAKEPSAIENISDANVLVYLGDSVTTDHISPAGSIAIDSPAGKYLTDEGVLPEDFNSYGSRRGNHEVMMRGTFANIRLRNKLAPGTEGSWTKYFPSGEIMSIYDAAMLYISKSQPLVIIAGKEYGTGSSRDWAAKGTRLLGVKAVIAASFERIHRSNLIGMGVLPLQFTEGTTADSIGIQGDETFSIKLDNLSPRINLNVEATRSDGTKFDFQALLRIDTPKELEYYRNGGILHYVLRQLAN